MPAHDEHPWRDLGRAIRDAVRPPKPHRHYVQVQLVIDGKLVHERSFHMESDPNPMPRIRLHR